MTTMTITIECGNAAFDPDPVPEINRLLCHIQSRLDEGCRDGKLFDENGNEVGEFKLTTPDPDLYYGCPEHQEFGDEWYYRDCPGAW